MIVLGKGGANVELCRQLFLTEAGFGLVIDWDLRAEKAGSDVYLRWESFKRMRQWSLPVSVRKGGRGFASKTMGGHGLGIRKRGLG